MVALFPHKEGLHLYKVANRCLTIALSPTTWLAAPCPFSVLPKVDMHELKGSAMLATGGSSEKRCRFGPFGTPTSTCALCPKKHKMGLWIATIHKDCTAKHSTFPQTSHKQAGDSLSACIDDASCCVEQNIEICWVIATLIIGMQEVVRFSNTCSPLIAHPCCLRTHETWLPKKCLAAEARSRA